eukprot:TRINITY_DN6565_c0_g2_i1.p1 TRINITY_DN6565_c0_g2~~TRINITY_DN6565_c0_g2_i1.p1  ORF type:complete len:2768 (-),score=924.18 TRINITY_DN6565_c0_g2_i1:226-8529(-)
MEISGVLMQNQLTSIVLPFLEECVRFVKNTINLCIPKYLLWRLDLYVFLMDAYQMESNKEKLEDTMKQARSVVSQLTEELNMDPPISPSDQQILDKATRLLDVLEIKISSGSSTEKVESLKSKWEVVKGEEGNLEVDVGSFQMMMESMTEMLRNPRERVISKDISIAKPYTPEPQEGEETHEVDLRPLVDTEAGSAVCQIMNDTMEQVFTMTKTSETEGQEESEIIPVTLEKLPSIEVHYRMIVGFFSYARLDLISRAVERFNEHRELLKESGNEVNENIVANVDLLEKLASLRLTNDKLGSITVADGSRKVGSGDMAGVVGALHMCLSHRDFTTGPDRWCGDDMLEDTAVELWNDYMKNFLLEMDTMPDQIPNELLVLGAEVTNVILRTLLAIGSMDGVLIAQVAIRSASYLSALHDLRQSVSLLRRTINRIGDIRSELNNFQKLKPEQSYDRAALTMSSILIDVSMEITENRPCKENAEGTGCFGRGSLMDSYIRDLACLECDILSIFFSTEIKISFALKLKENQNPPTEQKIASRAMTARGESAFTPGVDNIVDENIPFIPLGNTEKVLRSFCKDNVQWLCLLICELTKVVEEERKEELLNEVNLLSQKNKMNEETLIAMAHNSLVSLETRPSAKKSARRMTLADNPLNDDMLDTPRSEGSVDSASTPRSVAHPFAQTMKPATKPPPPIFMSRDNRQVTFQLAPFVPKQVMMKASQMFNAGRSTLASSVATTATQLVTPKIQCFRIFGKQFGSGADVSIHNNELPGTGIPIDPESETFSVSGLVPNNSYVFAVAAYDSDGDVIGQIGRTTKPILAANPMPQVLLEQKLGQAAIECSDMKHIRSSTFIAMKNYFLFEKHVPICTGNPLQVINLNEDAVIVAPKSVLKLFINSFLEVVLMEDGAFGSGSPGSIVLPPVCNVNDDKYFLQPSQWRRFYTIRVLCLLMRLAERLNDEDLMLRIIESCWNEIELLLNVDDSLANVLLDCIIELRGFLLSISKPHWNKSLCNLYCKIAWFIGSVVTFSGEDSIHEKIQNNEDTRLISPEFLKNPTQALKLVQGQLLHQTKQVPSKNLNLEESDNAVHVLLEETFQKILSDPESVLEWLNTEKKEHPHVIRALWFATIALHNSRNHESITTFWKTFDWNSGLLPKNPDNESVLVDVGLMKAVEPEVTEDDEVDTSNQPQIEVAIGENEEEEMPMDDMESGIMDAEVEFAERRTFPVGDAEKEECVFLAQILSIIASSKKELFEGVFRKQVTSKSLFEKRGPEQKLVWEFEQMLPNFESVKESDLEEPEIIPEELPKPEPIKEEIEEPVVVETTKKKTKGGKASPKGNNATPPEESEVIEEPSIPPLQDICNGLVKSIDLFSRACDHSNVKLSTRKLWDMIVESWVSPAECDDVVPLSDLSTVLLQMCDAIDAEQRKASRPKTRVQFGGEEVFEEEDMAAHVTHVDGEVVVQRGRDKKGTSATDEELSLIGKLGVFIVSGMCLRLDFTSVRIIAEKLERILSFISPDKPFVSKLLEEVLQITCFALQRLWHIAAVNVRKEEIVLEECEAEFEVYQEKKRKKKKNAFRLVGEEELTPEELAYQEKKGNILDTLETLRGLKEDASSELNDAKNSLQALRRGRSAQTALSCAANLTADSFMRVLSQGGDIQSEYRTAVKSLKQLISLMREKRGTEGLSIALSMLGNIHHEMHEMEKSEQSWRDSVDALFGALDVSSLWTDIVQLPHSRPDPVRNSPLQKYGPWTCILGAVQLTKLCMYSPNVCNDLKSQLDKTRFVGRLLASLWDCTLPHPARDIDFASYRPRFSIPELDLLADNAKLKKQELFRTLKFVTRFLCLNGFHLESLPISCLWEHLAVTIDQDLLHAMEARVWRVIGCANVGRPTEAVQWLKGVVEVSTFDEFLDCGKADSSEKAWSLHSEESLDSEVNASALQWLTTNGHELLFPSPPSDVSSDEDQSASSDSDKQDSEGDDKKVAFVDEIEKERTEVLVHSMFASFERVRILTKHAHGILLHSLSKNIDAAFGMSSTDLRNQLLESSETIFKSILEELSENSQQEDPENPIRKPWYKNLRFIIPLLESQIRLILAEQGIMKADDEGGFKQLCLCLKALSHKGNDDYHTTSVHEESRIEWTMGSTAGPLLWLRAQQMIGGVFLRRGELDSAHEMMISCFSAASQWNDDAFSRVAMITHCAILVEQGKIPIVEETLYEHFSGILAEQILKKMPDVPNKTAPDLSKHADLLERIGELDLTECSLLDETTVQMLRTWAQALWQLSTSPEATTLDPLVMKKLSIAICERCLDAIELLAARYGFDLAVAKQETSLSQRFLHEWIQISSEIIQRRLLMVEKLSKYDNDEDQEIGSHLRRSVDLLVASKNVFGNTLSPPTEKSRFHMLDAQVHRVIKELRLPCAKTNDDTLISNLESSIQTLTSTSEGRTEFDLLEELMRELVVLRGCQDNGLGAASFWMMEQCNVSNIVHCLFTDYPIVEMVGLTLTKPDECPQVIIDTMKRRGLLPPSAKVTPHVLLRFWIALNNRSKNLGVLDESSELRRILTRYLQDNLPDANSRLTYSLPSTLPELDSPASVAAETVAFCWSAGVCAEKDMLIDQCRFLIGMGDKAELKSRRFNHQIVADTSHTISKCQLLFSDPNVARGESISCEKLPEEQLIADPVVQRAYENVTKSVEKLFKQDDLATESSVDDIVFTLPDKNGQKMENVETEESEGYAPSSINAPPLTQKNVDTIDRLFKFKEVCFASVNGDVSKWIAQLLGLEQ